MITKTTFVCCIAVLLFSIEIQAQPIPVGALPTHYNGGFVGEAGALRMSSFSFFNYKDNSYPALTYSNSGWKTGTYISVDQFVKKLRSGIGFTVGHVNDRYLTTNSMSLAISPKFSFKGKYTFAPFTDFSFQRIKATYGMVLDFPGIIPADHSETDILNIKTGFLINSDKAYIGVSANVMQYSKSSLYEEPTLRLLSEMKYTFQAGYTFQQTPESDFSFTPQLVLSYNRYSYQNLVTLQQDRYNEIALIDLNLMCRYKKFISGINSRGLVLGYQSKRFKLQVANFYMNREREAIGKKLSDNTTFMVRYLEGAQNKYSGSVSLRYILKKNPSVKMQGF